MPSCPTIEQLELLAAGTLAGDEADSLRSHLAACRRCAEQYEQSRANQALAAQLREVLKDRCTGSLPEAGSPPGADSTSLPTGRGIPGYRLVREIHRGGQGVVYEAFQESTRRRVALKVILGGQFAGRASKRRFEREVELAAGLNHPNIVTIYDSGISNAFYYFAMDYVDGQRLDNYVSGRRLSIEQKLELFAKIAAAVSFAHRHGVIHRDLKPSNILVDAGAEPQVLDFGLAKQTADSATGTDRSLVSFDGHVLGTLAYMSPEHTRGMPARIDVRSDVYSLGVILYELLTGRLPYDLRNVPPHEAARAICEEPPQEPGTLDRRLRGDVGTIVLKALEKTPSRRYQSAEELADDIRRYIKGEAILARAPSSLYLVRRKLSRHRLRITVAVLALALVLGGLWGGTWWRDRSLEREHARRRAGARREVLFIQRDSEAGRAEHSLGQATALWKRYPELPEAYLVWAQARWRVARNSGDDGLVDGVIANLKARVGDDSRAWALRALLADIYARTGDPRAEQLQLQADRDAPDTAEAWYLRSFATLDIERAVRYAKEAVQRDGQHRLAWERLAYLALQADDFDSAEEAAHKLIDLGGDPFEWTMFEGHVLTTQRRCNQAVEHYTRAAALPTSDPEAPYRFRALAYLCLREYARAVEDYSRVVQIPGGTGTPWDLYKRATPLWVLGRTEEAVEDYRRFRDSKGFPSCADARLFLVLQDQARLHREAGRLEEARQALEEASEALESGRRGAVPGSWLEKIFACLAGDLTSDGLVSAAKSPEQVCEGYYYAGEACLLADRPDQARDWFQKCVATDLMFDQDTFPPDPMNEWHLARWRLGLLSADTSADQE